MPAPTDIVWAESLLSINLFDWQVSKTVFVILSKFAVGSVRETPVYKAVPFNILRSFM